MSDSPSASAVPSTKRPLDDESSTSGPTDQPDAKRPALDKNVKAEETEQKLSAESEAAEPASTAEDVKAEGAKVEEVKTETNASLTNGHNEAGGDVMVPDAPNGTSTATTAATASVPTTETQPIQSTAEQHDRAGARGGMQQQGHQDETGWIHVRAVISSVEAATVIGKGGENVSQIRRLSGAKCTVSEYSRGAVERILTVSGLVDATAKVCVPMTQAISSDANPSRLLV